ncbi:MAG TPA: insulinase family protein [Candidatus Acidoferrales bacterium]|jgi:zinc protease|nr:insulinase family protein [Candidatus Acidoferrales bacterium]
MIGRKIQRTLLGMAFVIAALASGVAQTASPAKKTTAAAKQKSSVQEKVAPAEKQKAPGTQQQDLAAADIKAIKEPPLPAFHPQLPKRIELSNGMVIFLQEDHELPLINAVAYIRGGSIGEPADKVGLVSVYGSSWRTGGTKDKTGDQLDDALEARAARVETGGGLNLTTARLSCLKGDFDFVFNVFNDVLRNPEFRQDKIELAKNNLRTGIARRNDDLNQIAAREATKLGYGADSPYAREAEYATVAAITRQDLLDWHARYVHPNNIIFGITGDFDSAVMEKKLRAAFESWPKGAPYQQTKAAIDPAKPGIYFVAKNDVNQSEVRMVAPGIRRDDPDFFAVEVMNEIFGGGFSSRLFSNLRTKEGLAYAVGGGITAPYDHPGLALVQIGTKSGTTAAAVQGLYREIDSMHTQPVTQVELQRGKDAILNSFIFDFDSKEKVMQERMTYEFYGYPADFLERFQKGVEKVTDADVDRVAKKYLIKDKFAVLVVGKSADFDKQLDTFGKVTTIDITIPEPGAATSTSAPAASNPQGKALLAKVIEAAGGEAKLKAIKSLRRKATLQLKAQGVTVETESLLVAPDTIRTALNTPGGEMVMVTSPKDSFMSMGAMGVRPMPDSQKKETLNSLQREIWLVAQHAEDPQYTFTASGTEKIGNVEAAILDIHDGSQQWRWYVDPQTGHILRAQFEAHSAQGPATDVVDLSDWKTVDGVTVPFHQEVTSNGTPAMSITVTDLQVNPPVDPKLFEKPAEK